VKKPHVKKTRRRGPTLIQQSRRKSPAEKAAFHTLTGAGRSHVKRQFFGLSDADEDAIADRVDRYLDKVTKEAR
jgi:hypothetical protein